VKYQNWVSFEKHLSEAAPAHLSPIYLAVSNCSFERKKIFALVLSAIQKKDPRAVPLSYEASGADLKALFSQLNSPSLFGGASIIVLDEIDKLKKEGWEALYAYIEHPSSFSFLILGASPVKNLTTLYQKGKKELVALDLSDEKPWDRKARLQRYLVQSAHRENKTLNSDAAAYLLEHIGLDLSRLDQELLKLICFVGEEKQIRLEEVKAVCSGEKEVNTWQLAEMLVWEAGSLDIGKSIELSGLSWLLPFIGQIRYQLQLGLQIAAYLEQGVSVSEVSQKFPQVRGIDKRISSLRRYTSSYFRKALHALFDTELLAKNSSCNPALLLDLLIFKLNCLKIDGHSLSTS
jgi:DNA polymerase-3 subunit delta